MEFILNDYHRNISNEELLNDLLRVYASLGKSTITQSEYTKLGKYGINTFRKRFGGWNQALKLCNISPNIYQVAASKSSHNHLIITDEQMLSDLQYVAHKLGRRSFSSKEYNEHGHFSSASYFKHFGNWNTALSMAGLDEYKQVSEKRISDLLLLEEIERLWIMLGRQPTTTDIRDGKSKYTLNTFSRHFGGWRNALVAFIDWINSEKDDNENRLEKVVKEESDITISNITAKSSPPPISHITTREINLRLRFKVMMRDNFKCSLCGASPSQNPNIILHIDHIQPWSKGGETVIDNLQTLCSDCNLGKGNMIME